jgi:trans-aconitate 2-methyltransferase
MVTWDPTTYLNFAAERARPFHDLAARVRPKAPRSIVDLGCGPGGLTAALAERWSDSEVLGVDSSPQMIARASSYAVPGRLAFALGDLREWRPQRPVDVIVSNAALQWVPGHLDLLRRWAEEALTPGGWLALQVPGNLSDPLHARLAELCRSPRWAEHLAHTQSDRIEVPDPEGYAEALCAAGCEVDAWETTYLHILDPDGVFGSDAVLTWAKGTALRPALDALPDKGMQDDFLAEYAELLRAAYPRRPWGTPLEFRRVFAVAHRKDAA